MTTPTLRELEAKIDFYRRMFGIKDKDFNIQILALIAKEVAEARIAEVKRAASHNNSEYTSDYLESRIVQLTKETE